VVNSLMERNPTPIILLSSLEKTDSRIFDALQSGAFEFIDKPTDLDRMKVRDYRLLDLIKEASQTDITLLKARPLARKNNSGHAFEGRSAYDIIVIGASTRGPGAGEYIINNLPANLSIPVVIAQHMPQRYLETFRARLDQQSQFTINLAER